MTQQQQLQAMYQAFGRGDVPAILEQLRADVEWEYDAIDHGIPWLKPGRGTAHVAAFFAVVGEQLTISRFDVGPLFETGRQVIAQIGIEATVKSTGKQIRDVELHLWTFDDAGRVARFRHVVDTHQHWLASR